MVSWSAERSRERNAELEELTGTELELNCGRRQRRPVCSSDYVACASESFKSVNVLGLMPVEIA